MAKTSVAETKHQLAFDAFSVRLRGLADIMFDRFIDHSKEDRPPEKKFYLEGDNRVVLPNECIYSFLFRDLPPRGVIRKVEARGAADYISAGQANLIINPTLIPFVDGEGSLIVFNGFGPDKRFYIVEMAGITKMAGGKVIKQEARKRPVLRLPWFLDFKVELWANEKIDAEKLRTYFDRGGLEVSLGTFRPRFGRFMVERWETKK